MDDKGRDWQKDSWEWLRYAAQLPSEPIPYSGISAGTVIVPGRCIFLGGPIFNASGATHTYSVRDGFDTTGPLLASINLANSTGSILTVPVTGVLVKNAVFLDTATGPISGSMLVIPLWKYPFTPPGY